MICPGHIAAPQAFIRSRLAAWRTPDGAILAGHWTSRISATATTKTARRLIAARHGLTGAALLRPDETTLTAQRIAQHHHLLITRADAPARLVHLDSA